MWKHFKFDPNSVCFSCHTDEKLNEFDILLRSEWDRAVAQGLFTFEIDYNAKRKILRDDEDRTSIIELNSNRYEKRRMPYPFTKLDTPFDNKKFNFNKIIDGEILIALDTDQQSDKHLVIINNSPIRPYHVLLVPERQEEYPQILTVDCILFGLQFVVSSAHPFIFAGFNSLCGYASINHLHLHGMYIPDSLFIQTVKCSPFHAKSNCYLLDLLKTQAFAFEAKNIDQFDQVARHVHTITKYLTSRNVAHNVAIVKGDSFSTADDAVRIFVWFRQSILNGEMFERCNFACVELAGFMPLQYEEVFIDLTGIEVRKHLDGIALATEAQQQIRDDVKNLLDKKPL